VAGASELEIDAPAETVWDVLTAIDRWPAWNPDVKSVSLQKTLDTALADGLRHLKSEAEQRASSA
jgi:uncharacterized protein YndB with AHSA1/START domain